MGPVRQIVTGTPTRLKRRVRMRLLTGTGKSGPVRVASKKMSKENAAQIVQVVKGMRAKFIAAYPGETRTQMISNAEWRKRGYSHLADLNEVLGLDES